MEWFQPYLLPMIAVGIGFHFGVSWALLSRFIQARDQYLLYWGAGWLMLSVNVLALLLTQIAQHPSITAIQHMTFIAAAGAFLIGQSLRQDPRRSTRSLAVSVAVAMALLSPAAAWLAPGAWDAGSTRWLDPVALPLLAGAGGAFAYAAWLTWPRLQVPDTVSWLLFGSFTLGGLQALIYPLFPDWPTKVLVQIAVSATFSLLFAVANIWQTWEQVRGIHLFRRIVEALNRPLGMQEALDEALDLVMELHRLPLGWILLRNEGRGGPEGDWTLAAARGFFTWATHGIRQKDFPIDTCLCLRNVEKSEVIGAVNVLDCVRMSEFYNHSSGRHATVPLGAGGQVVGLMNLALPRARFLSPHDLQLLTALGEQIGLALERARLYDELKEKEAARGELLSRLITAQEEERGRIARELHDGVGQALTALVVNLDMISRPGSVDAALADRLRRLKDLADVTLVDIRRVMHDLRPSILDDLGLPAAVRWLVTSLLEPASLQVSLELQGLDERLPPPLEITVFRILQEAAHNVVKHARASGVAISVQRQNHELTIRVEDDGQGMRPPGAAVGGGASGGGDAPVLSHGPALTGMGLPGIRERVRLAGGQLSIDSRPGKGTTIIARLPVVDPSSGQSPSLPPEGRRDPQVIRKPAPGELHLGPDVKRLRS